MERRKIDKHGELQYEDFRKAPSMQLEGPKIFGSTQEKVVKNVTVIRNDDSESTNSDTETWNCMKERNLKNLKRKAIHSRSRKQQDASSSTDSSDDNDPSHKDSSFYDRKHKMSSTASSSSSNSKKSGEPLQQSMSPTLPSSSTTQQQQNDEDSSTRPPRKKKSRWSEMPASSGTSVNLATITNISTPQTMSSTITTSSMSSNASSTPMLTTITRSDPALLNYARMNFGTINLSDEDWLKAEEHYKINLLFQDMQRKRQEIDQLSKNGKFKYEYDSDEDINGGTWEHKLRAQEMEATVKWADALSSQCQGRHHIGDFLPPGEFLMSF